MANVLVLGGSGFVGTELIAQLKKQNDKICVIYHQTKCKFDVENIKADLRDENSIKEALKGRNFDVIYHVASLPGDTGNPHEMIDVNVVGLLNMLEWARANPVGTYVISSSISAYEWYPATKFNPPDYMPVDEDHPCRPKDMYATSKRMQEILALTYYHQYKVPITVLRLTAVVGPGGKGGGRGWRQFAEMLDEGKKVQIPHFSEDELCHYVDVRDVARMHIEAGKNPNALGQIFNCCAKDPTRGLEFVNIVKKIVPNIEVECGFAWSMAQGGEVSFSMEKAKKLLGFEPKYSIEDAIMSIKEWVDAGGLDSSKEDNMDNKFNTGIKEDKS